jgi:hypothetical protein
MLFSRDLRGLCCGENTTPEDPWPPRLWLSASFNLWLAYLFVETEDVSFRYFLLRGEL